jgi:hypothetical protein
MANGLAPYICHTGKTESSRKQKMNDEDEPTYKHACTLQTKTLTKT